MKNRCFVCRLIFSFFASFCLVVSSSAQEKTPVALDLDANVKYAVAMNPFAQNWEVALGIQGLSFYSNQESGMSLPSSPFKPFRTQLGVAASATKWFSPEIGLRTKVSGLWGRNVKSDDRETNAVKYFSLHEDVLVNVSNILNGYIAERRWDVAPYAGVGMTRNFTDNENALTLHLGLLTSYRFTDRLKAFCDLAYNIAGDEFDGEGYVCSNILKNHDRWITAELGIALQLGQNRWHRALELKDIEVVPWEETQRELHRTQRKVRDLKHQVEYYESQPRNTMTTVISRTPEISIFFEIGSSALNHKGQLENVRELVQTAIQEDRTVIVTGFADSSTGNVQLNEKLSARRADTIAMELVNMGVSPTRIRRVIGGGVDTLDPLPANRRVVVSLGND